MKWAELSAFNARPLGSIADGDSVTISDLSITEGDANRLIGESDSSIDCVDGDVATGTGKQFIVSVLFAK